jgi:antitoxin CptB
MTDELDTRRRRASYRAHHRGTKEMDLLIGRYADARLASFSADELSHFEAFLSLPDPMLQAWVFSGTGVGDDFAGLLADIRVFHRLAERAT